MLHECMKLLTQIFSIKFVQKRGKFMCLKIATSPECMDISYTNTTNNTVN